MMVQPVGGCVVYGVGGVFLNNIANIFIFFVQIERFRDLGLTDLFYLSSNVRQTYVYSSHS